MKELDSMLYVSRDRILYTRPVKLSEKEEKMLYLLASNEMLTYEELAKQGFNKNTAGTTKFRLVDKSRMKIETIAKVGYRLEEEVYFIGTKE